MRTIKSQKGISITGMLLLAPILGFYFYLGIKIGPEYMTFMSVKNAVEGVAEEQRFSTTSKADMRSRINKRLIVNEIRFLKKDQITFKDMKDGLHILTNYEREVPIIGNVHVLLKFDHDKRVEKNNPN